MDIINQTRVGVWKQQVTGAARQDADFFREAIIDADGSIAPTTGECKKGFLAISCGSPEPRLGA